MVGEDICLKLAKKVQWDSKAGLLFELSMSQTFLKVTTWTVCVAQWDVEATSGSQDHSLSKTKPTLRRQNTETESKEMGSVHVF